MSQATYEKLRALRLPAMAEAYMDQMNDPAMQQLSFAERMAFLTDAEWSKRKSNRLQRLIATARFDQPNAHIAEIDFSPRRELNRDLVLKLASCDFIQDTRNIVIMGAAGTGKSYLACALGMEACRRSYSVRFIRMTELIEQISLAKAEGGIIRCYKEFSKVDLLIIDDWMLTKITPEGATLAFEIVHRRHKKRSTVFCSQFLPAGWHLRIPEETLADAILDRIVYDSYQIQLRNTEDMPSMRQLHGIHL